MTDAGLTPAGRDRTELERLTIRRYLLGMVAQGVWWSGLILFPFIMAKSLAAPAWQVTLSVVMETSGLMLALYWGRLMARGGRRRGLFWSGLMGRAICIGVLWVHSSSHFMALLAVVYFFGALIYPAQNGILQANIRAEHQGRIFGWGALVQHLTAAAASLALGAVLNRDPDNFRYVYPVIGLIGFVYPLILAGLPRPADDTTDDPARFFTLPHLPLGQVHWRQLAGAALSPIREAADTFATDRRFLWYEANFTIYGLAYMMLIPVVPLFFTHELDLSYQAISSSRVLIASIGTGLLGPLAGMLMDRIHPVRLSTLSFGVIALYPATLFFGARIEMSDPALAAYLAFGLYSVGMAGINITWLAGSLAFAPPGQGGYYQGIHVALVGIRGILGPSIGFVVLKTMGYQQVFILATVVFLIAATSSALLGRRLDR